MKTFKNCAAQGDVYILRVKSLPTNVKLANPENGKFILAHSETGHHHVMEASPNVMFYESDTPLVSYLEVIEATDAAEAFLEHLRSYDTHESIKFDVGIYKVVNGRESAPEGWRKVSD